MKYYAVKYNDEKKIFESWAECQEYITNKKGFLYKSFLSLEEANNYLNDVEEAVDLAIPTVYIDGSYDVKTGNYSFGGVLIINNQEYRFSKAFKLDEYSSARNVAGEIKGASYIINYAIKQGIKELNIFYDYIGIEKWYKGEWKANSKIALEYIKFKDKVKDKIKINFNKVKSHSNNKYNDLADKLAKEALGI